MTGSTRAWEAEKSGADQRVRRVAGAWYERSLETGRGYDEWHDPVIDELVATALAGDDLDDALVRLGAARAHAGYSASEGRADLRAFRAALPATTRTTVPRQEAAGAFAAGYESVGPGSFPRPRLFGSADGLRARLADLYGRESEGVTPADTHALVAVAVRDEGAPHGEAVHVCAQTLIEHFGSAERVAWLGHSSFAVIVRRHPGLAVGISSLASALETHSALASLDVRVGLEMLPVARAGLATLVSELIDGTRPRGRVGSEHLERALVATPRPLARTGEVAGWERRRVRVVEAWRSGLSLVSLALATLLVAVGIARALGPASERFDGTPTTIFGPAVGFSDPHGTAGGTNVASAPLSAAAGAASGSRVSEPPAPAVLAASQEPATDVAPPPAPRTPPSPEPAPQESTSKPDGERSRPPEPEAADQPEEGPDDDPPPCTGLAGKTLKHCERDVRVSQEPGERGKAKGRDGAGGQ